jgi:hypothetical protein
MEDMYGKADPKPLPPSYTPEDLKRMANAEEQALLEDMSQTREGESHLPRQKHLLVHAILPFSPYGKFIKKGVSVDNKT